MAYMRCEYDVEFEHDGKEFIAFYVYDADVGRSWITDIQDENGDMIPKESIQRDGSTMRHVSRVLESDEWVELHPIAKQAMENEETRQAEKAAERAFSDYHGGSGPMSLTEQANRNWMEKRSLRG